MQKKLKSWRAIALILLTFVLVVFSTGCKKKPKPIVIAVIEPLSGPSLNGGELELRGALVANMIKKEALGRPIEIVSVDLKSDLMQSKKIATDFITKHKPVAIIGSYGSKYTSELVGALDGRKIPIIAPSITAVDIPNTSPFLYKLMYNDAQQARALATFAVEQLGAKKVGILVENNNDYSIALATAFEKVFVALSANATSVVDHIFYETGSEDFNKDLAKLYQDQPDIIFVPGKPEDCAKIIAQARRAGLTQPFLGGDAWDTVDFITTGSTSLNENIFFSAIEKKGEIDSTSYSRFANEYKQKYDTVAPLTSELSFDAYNIIVSAIESAKSDKSEKINAAIAKNQDFIGVTGEIAFDADNSVQRNIIIKTVVDGAFEKYIAPEKPAQNGATPLAIDEIPQSSAAPNAQNSPEAPRDVTDDEIPEEG